MLLKDHFCQAIHVFCTYANKFIHGTLDKFPFFSNYKSVCFLAPLRTLTGIVLASNIVGLAQVHGHHVEEARSRRLFVYYVTNAIRSDGGTNKQELWCDHLERATPG